MRVKGGQQVALFLLDEPSRIRGDVYLSSSTEEEASHESDEIGASFFTYSLVSLLRGAADFSQDGQVTIHEAYQYARTETLSRTESTLAGPQRPSWHIELTGTGDLVLTDLMELEAGIVFTEELEGQMFIKRGQHNIVAEINKAKGTSITIVLPVDSYTITIRNDDGTLEASITLDESSITTLTIGDFLRTKNIVTRTRGDEEMNDEELKDKIDKPVSSYDVSFIHFGFSFVPGLGVPFPNQPYYVGLDFNLVLGINYGIRGAQSGTGINIVQDTVYGAQFAVIGNIVEGGLKWFQWAGVFNIFSGSVRGLQSAGVFNIVSEDISWLQASGVFIIASGSVKGAQGAGVFNITSGTLTGVQGAGVFNITSDTFTGVQAAGVFNSAINVTGIQAGTLNIADKIEGSQIGIINIADSISGLQIGLLNIGERIDGIPIGLINISRNGLMTLSFEGDFNGFFYLSFQSGKTLYTLLSAGTQFFTVQTDPVLSTIAGLGLHFDLGPFFIEGDAAAKKLQSAGKNEKNFHSLK